MGGLIMGKKGLIFVFILLVLFNIQIEAAVYELGDQGEGVKQIQQYLYDIGYDVNIDGIFGQRTREIVKNFQYNNGLKVDGVVGEETLKVLEEMAKDITYIVQPDDTLSGIAAKYNLSTKALKDFNQLKNDLIRIGQELKIPRTGIGGGEDGNVYTNIFHEVRPGDSLYLLARKYGVEIETIKLANNLRTDIIYVGQNLVIPHLQRDINQPFELKKGAFIWPVIGRISSTYSYRIHPIRKERHFHGGIDIAVPLGTPIRAAAAGTVVQSGYINGFGKTIVIDHGNGIKTLYAHNSRLLVRAGAQVNLGQIIAQAGSTGTSTGSHLDFRIYKDENTVNPLNYLP